MINTLICICCPLGCTLTVESCQGKVVRVEGNTCIRGQEYAINEFTNPQRTVTSTMMTDKGVPVSVKTKDTISKDKILECMKIINKITVKTPVKSGDIVAENVFGSDIVATSTVE